MSVNLTFPVIAAIYSLAYRTVLRGEASDEIAGYRPVIDFGIGARDTGDSAGDNRTAANTRSNSVAAEPDQSNRFGNGAWIAHYLSGG